MQVPPQRDISAEPARRPERQPPAERADAPAPDDGSSSRWRWQFAVVVGLLVGFAALAATMIVLAGGDDRVWQRRVYVFGAVEAVVFTAVGWLFGREVHRAEAKSARSDAARAKREAADARHEALRHESRAAQAEREAAVEHTKGRAMRAAIRGTTKPPRPDGPRDVGATPAPAALNLQAFADELYGDAAP